MRIAAIIGSIVAEGYGVIMAKIGTYFGSEDNSDIFSENTEIWQHYGFCSRPKKADNLGCCEGIIQSSGGQDRCVATRDLRSSKALGDLDEGDTAIYADVDTNAVATMVCKESGLIYINSPVEIVNGETKTAHVIYLDPKENIVAISHEAGHSITMTDDMVQLKCGNSILQLSESGITIAGSITLVGSIVLDPTSIIQAGTINALSINGVVVTSGGSPVLV